MLLYFETTCRLLLSYITLLNKPVGLLIDSHELIFKNGINRLILDEDFSTVPQSL